MDIIRIINKTQDNIYKTIDEYLKTIDDYSDYKLLFETLYYKINMIITTMDYEHLFDNRTEIMEHHRRGFRRIRFIWYYFLLRDDSVHNFTMNRAIDTCDYHMDCMLHEKYTFYRFVRRSGGVKFIIRAQRRFRRRRAARKIARWWLAIAYNPHHPIGARIQLTRFESYLRSN